MTTLPKFYDGHWSVMLDISFLHRYDIDIFNLQYIGDIDNIGDIFCF